MALDPQAFMDLMVKRVDFSNENKALLKLDGDWGNKISLQSINVVIFKGSAGIK
jgi:hypothetical protein